MKKIIFGLLTFVLVFSVNAEENKSVCYYHKENQKELYQLNRQYINNAFRMVIGIKNFGSYDEIYIQSSYDEIDEKMKDLSSCPQYFTLVEKNNKIRKRYITVVDKIEDENTFILQEDSILYYCNYKNAESINFDVNFKSSNATKELYFSYNVNNIDNTYMTINDYTKHYNIQKEELRNKNMKNEDVCLDDIYIKTYIKAYGGNTYYTYNVYESSNYPEGAIKYTLHSSSKREYNFNSSDDTTIDDKIYVYDNPIYQEGYFCTTTSSIWQLVGYLFTAIRILIPLIIIGLAIYDLTKVVISSERDSLNKAIKILVKRLIIGLLIFFIPAIVNLVMYLIDINNTYTKKVDICKDCLVSPTGKSCKDAKSASEEARKNKYR